jgi:hypothetical protein
LFECRPFGALALEAGCQPARYLVRVTPQGPQSESFGWEIREAEDSVTVQGSTETLALRCSTETFSTRVEALLDSTRVAASLALVLAVDATRDYFN